MDKTTLVYFPFVVGITFCASLLSSASVIVDNPLDGESTIFYNVHHK